MRDETTPAEPSPAELAELRRALEEAKQSLDQKAGEAKENFDRYLRAAAELDNLKKRTQREREEYIRFANESLLRELLPILDNFDRALEAARAGSQAQGVVAGVELIQRELLKVLEKFGLERYSALGATFDPARHEAVAQVRSSTEPENTVVGETARGYLLHGRVLRPESFALMTAPRKLAGGGAPDYGCGVVRIPDATV